MKRFKLIYSFETEKNNTRIEMIDDGCYTNDEINDTISDMTSKYSWFEEGEIYDENFDNDGNSLSVLELVDKYPNDWLEL